MISSGDELSDDDSIPQSSTPSNGLAAVGLGTSSGGLEVLEQSFQNMAPDSGLAFAMKIVERLGCPIWVESEVRAGSTFYYLPDAGGST